MSTYLVCFIVSKFDYVEAITAKNGIKFFHMLHIYLRSIVTVRVWTTPGTISQANYALSCAVGILAFYEQYYNIDYPLPKMDLIAIP